ASEGSSRTVQEPQSHVGGALVGLRPSLPLTISAPAGSRSSRRTNNVVYDTHVRDWGEKAGHEPFRTLPSVRSRVRIHGKTQQKPSRQAVLAAVGGTMDALRRTGREQKPRRKQPPEATAALGSLTVRNSSGPLP